jgi:DNA-binding NarL/FixJ family response regulator
MNVFVVNSHAIYRRDLVSSLELLDAVEAVDCADGTAAAWEHPALAGADVLIVDPSIVGGAAFILAVGDALNARVIGCTSAGDEGAVRAALAAGAVGFLRKDTLTLDVLEAALTAALAGAMVLATSVLAETRHDGTADAPRDQSTRSPESPLSERERRVLALLAEGHQTREIASKLCYSERTIKNGCTTS